MARLPLLRAASVGDLDEVRRLLEAGHDVDERGDPLTKDELKSVRWLLNEAGVNEAAGAFDKPFDYTPLMAAIAEGHFEVADALLDAGADVNATDSLKRMPLMLAIGWKQADLAERLIAAGADVDAKDACGDPVLTQAIEAGLWQVAHKLLDAGANPKPRAKKHYVPLAAITYHSSPEAAQIMLRLLDAGATLASAQMIPTIVEHHDEKICERILDLFPGLVDEISSDEVLRRAAKQRKLATLQVLIARGILPTNSADESSPLVDLIIGPARSSVDFYLEKYIDDDREIQCMQTLVDAGADVNHSGGNWKAPLHWAVFFYRSELCRWLLDHGADPNLVAHGKLPLAAAQEKLDEATPNWKLSKREARQYARLEAEARRIISLLEAAGGRRDTCAGSEIPAEADSDSNDAVNPVLDTPPAERRGLCDATFFKAYQVMIHADIDNISDMLEKDRKFVCVERDVHSRLNELKPPVGGVLALVKLRGQPWVYVAGCRRPRGDSPMQAWSRKLKSPVLYAGEESVASVVFYALYDRGQCVEAFESDGVWFRGGVDIDPEVQDESDRMHGTTFSSTLRDAAEVDWSAYDSEWEFLDRFLREQDAYLTFMWAGPSAADGAIEVRAYHDDEATAESVDRIDLAYYQPTPQQQRAAAAPPEDDRMYEAIKSGDVDAVKQLIGAGVDLNELPPRNDQSYLVIALGCALYNRSQEIVDLLLQSGADPDFGGAEPPVPRLMTWSSRSTDQMEMLLKLLAAGADINGRKAGDKSNPFMPGGQTALHKAAQSGQLNFVKLLLRHGAVAKVVDGAGRTPLDAARAWLKAVKQDRIKDVPSFTNELHVPIAQQTVELLESVERGELNVNALPSDEDLIEAEERLHAERRRVELEEQ